MDVRVGTSGYAYKVWKGRFYPPDLPDAEMLRFYSGRLPSVEINNTFYRMPARDLLARWASETPESFRFVLKAPRRITHEKRLGDVADALSYLLETASVMRDKLGPFLFQLPPFFAKDLPRLRAFLGLIPEGTRAAFEFRHESWFDDEVFGTLRERGAALCLADTDEETASPPLVPTASWGYLRLRRAAYADDALAGWIDRIRSQPWSEAYVFFKHEDEATGPALAERSLRLLAGGPSASA